MGRCCVELEMEVVDCGCRRRLMADGARSEKILARTLFLVFGGKTIGRLLISSYRCLISRRTVIACW